MLCLLRILDFCLRQKLNMLVYLFRVKLMSLGRFGFATAMVIFINKNNFFPTLTLSLKDF
jgi:hypothetical protein